MTGEQVPRIALVGATLIDGTGAPPVANSAAVLHGDQIHWTGSAGELDRTPECLEREGLELVDLTGRYLVPGPMDANVHLVADVDPHILPRYEPGEYDDLVIEAAQVALRAGITTGRRVRRPWAAPARTRSHQGFR